MHSHLGVVFWRSNSLTGIAEMRYVILSQDTSATVRCERDLQTSEYKPSKSKAFQGTHFWILYVRHVIAMLLTPYDGNHMMKPSEIHGNPTSVHLFVYLIERDLVYLSQMQRLNLQSLGSIFQ